MRGKSILVLAVVVAFVVGTMVAGAEDVFAKEKLTKLQKECKKEPKKDDKIKAHCELLNMIFNLQEQIDELGGQIDTIELTPGEQGDPGDDGSSCSISGTIVSCTDGTSNDVQGPTGATGSQGEQGETGPPGADAGAELDAILAALSVVPEVCDGVDNNVNGETDEGFPVGDVCIVGKGICEASGLKICSASVGITCDATPGPSIFEVCSDGLDNDCDGTVDEQDLRYNCVSGGNFAPPGCTDPSRSSCTVIKNNSPQCPLKTIRCN